MLPDVGVAEVGEVQLAGDLHAGLSDEWSMLLMHPLETNETSTRAKIETVTTTTETATPTTEIARGTN